MTIGDRVKQRRIKLGLSVDELASRINKNRATVYRYESKDIEKLPTTILVPLAEALQTTPAYLMGWLDLEEEHKKEDAVSDIFVKLRADSKFLEATEILYSLNEQQLDAVITMLSTFK